MTRHVQVALTVGAVANPLLFVPLALRAEVSSSWSHRVVNVGTFVTTWGVVGAAWSATVR